MLGMCSCIICKEVRIARGIHTHVDRAHLKLTKYSSGNNGKYSELAERARLKNEREKELYLKNSKKCENDDCSIDIAFEKHKTNKYCSSACAATVNNKKRSEAGWQRTEESRLKTRESLQKYREEANLTPLQTKHIKKCKVCDKEFVCPSSKRISCSRSCALKHRNSLRRQNRAPLLNYRADCAFKFSLKDFPEEFDFTLIEQYGWYKAKNRGNNLNGISRDHMVSVVYGFENNIPVEHISHPANCRLMKHTDNMSKGKKNVISYEELLERIDQWNSRYPNFWE
jgi:hypothetical protein